MSLYVFKSYFLRILKMKKINKLIILGILTAVILSIALFAEGDSASYGTASDPLVTLSYVNDTLKSQLKAEILEEVKSEMKSEITNEVISSMSGSDIEVSGGAFEVVHLTSGQQLLSMEACEIILRSGSASVVITSADNIAAGIGISDLTSGSEITNGNSVTVNHYLIVPRADGRGVVVTSQEAYLMVRGEYEIVG